MRKLAVIGVMGILIIMMLMKPVEASEHKHLVDLRHNKDSLQPLEGLWEFYWNELLEPEDFRFRSVESAEHVLIPGAWNGYLINGKQLTGDGYATYRTFVRTDGEGIIAFKIPRILTAYRMWVSGEEIAGAGRVGTCRSESEPQYLTQQAFVMVEEDIAEVIIQVSNFNHRSGGILENIYVGRSEQVLVSTKNALAYELFLFGSLMVIGVYHLVLYYYRKKDRALLFFSIYCLVIGLRTILVGEIFFIQVYPNFNWEIAHKMQTLSYYSAVLILMLFFREMYRSYVPAWVVNSCMVTTGIFSFLVLVTPARVFNHINPVFQVFTILVSGYILVILFRICQKKEPGTLFIAFGYAILIFTVFHDLIYLSILMSDYQFLNHIIRRGNLSSFGLLVFSLTHSFALAITYAELFNKNEKMTSELIDLNENLEQLVERRTTDLRKSYQKIEEQKHALEKTNRKLEKMSQKDALTKVWNRRYFDESFASEWQRALRTKSPISLLFLDIDDFKDYNDQYGHQAGDDCLVKVAKVLQEKIKRRIDVVARYGGEEFVVLLANADQTGAITVAEELRRAVEVIGVTVSIGVASMIPSLSKSPEDLIRAADQAMYLAKKSGKNRVES
ncbi:diguanylate cyclase (GGDEF) domain-containing protein [Tindallia magadiensis]|uniref:Diguanylate cyclase (GGDEF) domain-containing protein n=1 Tax=Tindallia magadiensis TaxID=69895 RepID=A0A1I3C768_9FIRM|nr:diguanylate cyclase [Tindallia magadiensis]SFH70404.1 diguanylate cyclase (GGDEF) domain-containing protein [Tindallia magadiensis]